MCGFHMAIYRYSLLISRRRLKIGLIILQDNYTMSIEPVEDLTITV